MEERIIIGAGRHAAETYYLLEDIGLSESLVAFAVDSPQPGQQLLGKNVTAISDVLAANAGKAVKPAVLVAVGAVDINKRLVAIFKEAGFPFFNAIHHNINAARQQYIGQGVTIAAGCVITCNVSIGDHSIINIGCTISHDCSIGRHVNISPGSHLAGNVVIEDDVFVGTGAIFIPKVRVGRGSIIAAGACITKDVPPYTMVAGMPAIVKKHLLP